MSQECKKFHLGDGNTYYLQRPHIYPDSSKDIVSAHTMSKRNVTIMWYKTDTPPRIEL